MHPGTVGRPDAGGLVPLRVRYTGAGVEGAGDGGGGTLLPPPVRDAVIWWPEEQMAELRRDLSRMPGGLEAEPLPEDTVPASLDRDAAVLYVDPAVAGYAHAYARSTGATAVRLPEGGEEWPAGCRRAVVLGDLLSFPLRALHALGCALPVGGDREEQSGFLHCDASHVGTLHLLKNLLARHGVFPRYAGSLFLAPEATAVREVSHGGETYLLGELAPAAYAAHLGSPRGRLFAWSHTTPFDAFLGRHTVLCSLSDRGTTCAPRPEARDDDERGFACLSGGDCIRAHQNPGLTHWLPAESFAANHVTWFGCDLVLHGDSPYRSYRALVFRLLAAPPVVSVLSSIHWSHGSLEELLHASLLLDEGIALGEYQRRLERFCQHLRGRAPAGSVLLGDPQVRPLPDDPAAGEGGRAGRRRRRVQGGDVPSSALLRARSEGSEDVLAAFVGPSDSGRRELGVLAFDATGTAPDEIVVDTDRLLLSARRRLRRWHGRLGFWRTILLSLRAALPAPAASEPDTLRDACQSCLDDAIALQDVAERTATAMKRRLNGVARADAHPLVAEIDFIRATAAALQPRLMDVVTRFSGTVAPHVPGAWQPSFFLEAARPGRCRCGHPRSEERWRAIFGPLRRVVLRCTRCGMTGDVEEGLSRPRMVLERDTVCAGAPVHGRLYGLAARADMPIVIGATLASEPDTDGVLSLQSCALGSHPGTLDLSWDVPPARSSAQQQIHAFIINDLALHIVSEWIRIVPR